MTLIKKKIVFLTTRFPFPVASGRMRIIIDHLDFLNGTDFEIHLIAFVTSRNEKIDAQKRLLKNHNASIKTIDIIPLPPPMSSIVKALWYSLILNRKSIQECFYYSKKNEMYINKVLNNVRPDVVFCDMIRTAQFAAGYTRGHVYKVFDMDDILSARYEDLLESDIDILGTFNENIPRIIKLILIGRIKRALVKREIALLKKNEHDFINSFDSTIVVSPLECTKLRNLRIQEKNVHFILPAANTAPSQAEVEKKRYTISFMGALNYSPNEKGLIHFIECVFSKLVMIHPMLRFFIVGDRPTLQIKKTVAPFKKSIVLTGFINDFRNVIASTEIFVAPVYNGSGVHVKIIDALSIGMPVVTTSVGISGLPISVGKEIVLVDSDSGYIQALSALIENKSERERLSQAGIEYIRSFHNPKILRRQFLCCCELGNT
jgi:glycosyltransferase involved in cell wall biosynthesis